jgi:hypothetical protein
MNCLLGSLGMAAFALQEKLTFDVFTAMKVPGYCGESCLCNRDACGKSAICTV